MLGCVVLNLLWAWVMMMWVLTGVLLLIWAESRWEMRTHDESQQCMNCGKRSTGLGGRR